MLSAAESHSIAQTIPDTGKAVRMASTTKLIRFLQLTLRVYREAIERSHLITEEVRFTWNVSCRVPRGSFVSPRAAHIAVPGMNVAAYLAAPASFLCIAAAPAASVPRSRDSLTS